MDIRSNAEYKCKCGIDMGHAVGDATVLVFHGTDRRSVPLGDTGRYEALEWIGGLHRIAREHQSIQDDRAIGKAAAELRGKRKR